MKNLLFLGITFCLLTLTSFAQEKGTITGFVTDAKTGAGIEFIAKVSPEGMNIGATTGIDGEYALRLDPGTYTIVFYEKAEYQDHSEEVVVEAGKVVELNVALTPITGLEEITIVAEKLNATSIAAGLEAKQKAKATTEVMTSDAIQKTPANNVADAVQQIPGISIVDGKDVFVRGLGDRYTKTVLNSMEIPGLDPDKNSVQMDIFPTSVVDNITVFKTFTPDLQGDFTGGVVNIKTKDFQEKATFQIKAGLGYNTEASLRNDFLLYQGGKLDFLGFDDGTRKLPVSPYAKFPDPTQNDPRLNTMTSQFSGTMAASQMFSGLNNNFGLVLGNSRDSVFNRKNLKYGYNFVANYRNNYRFVEEVIFNEYRKDQDKSINQIYRDRESRGSMGEQEVTWSALFGQTLKVKNGSSFSLTAFHTQSGLSQAAHLIQENFESNPGILDKNGLQYTQRSVSNLNFSAKQQLNKWNINWKVSPTYSSIQDPDVRSTALEVEDDGNGGRRYALNQAVGAEIKRTFRSLSEYNISARYDMDRDLVIRKKNGDSIVSNLKVGAMNTYKNRTFDVYDYIFLVENATEYSGNPDDYFLPENIWSTETDQGTYAKGERELANSFQASQNVAAVYGMHVLPLTNRLEFVYGARIEKADNYYTGQNSSNTINYRNEKVLDELNVLPSLNVKYRLSHPDSTKVKMNLRAALSQTLARPSFKEKSISQIYDPIQGRRYNGNIDLIQTDIYNADIRWEAYLPNAQVYSVSAFYKKFINPIEIVSFDVAPSEVKPINAGQADIFGFEFEVRQRITNFNSSDTASKSLYFGLNATYVNSRIDMSKVLIDKGNETVTEKQIREENARDGEVIGQYRSMSGQSPFIINSYLNYVNRPLGLDININYNVQGERLSVVGIGRLPNVYEKPFHSLNFKISKKFGEEQNWKASISAQNLLNQKRQRVYQSYMSDSQIYDSFYRGMSFSGSVTFTF
ncbi:TonB-dependent receptor [Lishizhenia sp.]|uniref:TonB-dependent receptor n=1 Tax=Lishizhenia sp. TaxID=2497594 RepID=UPI00299E764A|nr:TonB-dependent receptor plug domain-containing protein [Lishizhenia sp.]MDX1445691.1 TonB-dependent receptor plug domain-containing protein [Lishizhenia sp.]